MQLRIIQMLVFCLAIISAYPLRAQNSGPLTGKDFGTLTTKDTLFKEPFIDVDEWRDKPMRHRYVHGGFKGNGARFSFYFPSSFFPAKALSNTEAALKNLPVIGTIPPKQYLISPVWLAQI